MTQVLSLSPTQALKTEAQTNPTTLPFQPIKKPVSKVFSGELGTFKPSDLNRPPSPDVAGQPQNCFPLRGEELLQFLSHIIGPVVNLVSDIVGLIHDWVLNQQQPQQQGQGVGSNVPEQSASTPNLDSGRTPRPLEKSGEFLWKPSADKDGKLVILLPAKYTGKVSSVEVLSPDKSQILAKGTTNGVPGNGNREHYRFAKTGAEFPDGAVVKITMESGAIREVKIEETSERFAK